MTTTIDAQAITIADIQELTPQEQSRLAQLEQDIQSGFRAFFGDAGAALEEIKRDKLYRQQWGTWEDYSLERWGMSHDYAERLIEASQVLTNLGEAKSTTIVGILPTKESHCRPLAQLPPPLQVEAWKEAAQTAPDGKVTAKHVADVAKAIVLEQDRNKRYQESEKLYTGYIAATGDRPTDADSILQWGKEKKGLTPRQAEVLREDIEVFATNPSANHPNKSVGGVATATPAATNGKTPTPQSQPVEDDEKITKERAVQIAGVLNSYSPGELVTAMTYMDEEYKLQLLIHLAPIIEADMLAEFVDPSVTQALADTFYLFGERLDEVSA